MHTVVIDYPEVEKTYTGLIYKKTLMFSYLDGKLHNLNGPAVQNIVDGYKEYWRDGQLHNANGFAKEFNNGTGLYYGLYYIDGILLSKEEFLEKKELLQTIRVSSFSLRPENYTGWLHVRWDKNKWYDVHLVNGLIHQTKDVPSLINYDGTKQWHQYGKLHRENDLPAIEECSGKKLWYKDGEIHRDNGPAVIYSDGRREWYVMGTQYTEDSYNKLMKSPH